LPEKYDKGFQQKRAHQNNQNTPASSYEEIFTRHQWMGLFELLRGYDDDLAREFAMSLIPLTRASATVVVRGFSVTITPKSISRITTLPLGLQWRKEDKTNNTIAQKGFFLEGEEPIEEKNGVRRESIPYPWNEVSYHIIKYISYEGRYSVVYGYHFRLLHELLFGGDTPPHNILSVP